MQRSPISILQNNVVHEFEALAIANAIDQRTAVKQQLVSPEIKLICDRVTPRSPFAELKSRKMVLQESYLVFLWGYIYSSIVIYEECIQKKMLNDTFLGIITFDTRLTKRARKLQIWIAEFAEIYTDWDTQELPNPEVFMDSEEEKYCLKANQIYLKAVSFLLMHEYAHLVLGHADKTAGDYWSLDQEKDADNFALSCLFENSSDEKHKRITALSIVTVFTSNLLLTKSFDGVWQVRHPHLHNRLLSAISSLDFSTEESKSYFYYFASSEIRQYLANHGISVKPMITDTAEQLFFQYMAKLDNYDPKS